VGVHGAPSNPFSRVNHTINGMAQAMTVVTSDCSPEVFGLHTSCGSGLAREEGVSVDIDIG